MSNNTKNELKIPNFIKSNKEELLKFRNYYEMIINSSKDLKNMNTQSLINALINLYKLNLSINPIKKELALIPYGDELQVQIQEDGWLTLLQRTGLVVDFQREKITTAHKFNKENNKWEINPALIFERKTINTIGYYCYISLLDKNGKINNFYKGMTVEEINQHKDKYGKTYNKKSQEWKLNHIWTSAFDQMALKTVVKALIREINKTPIIVLNNQDDINLALQLDQGVVIDEETIAYKDNTGEEVKIINSNNETDNNDLNSALSKLEELEKEEEIIESFEV
ncbi:RecT family recombinase [Spiroplasma endosymbiont of Danaus chrysippus]|uniref:RecT family recombinase n=1 Tax=Spiroplasma endosymbiont of Danaus chrysippus TaxID=2691041 RepID=UPI00157B6EBD|nr:RecT family recombinase [Spiroplasma endosymbiont of Danaus chrysippus]